MTEPTETDLAALDQRLHSAFIRIAEEFAKLHTRLDIIERKLDIIPYVRYLDSNEFARKAVHLLRVGEANSPPPSRESIPVPQE